MQKKMFDPWSRKTPHAAEQLSPGTTAVETMLFLEPGNYSSELLHHSYWNPGALEPTLRNRRSRHTQKLSHRNYRGAAAHRNSRKVCTGTQHRRNNTYNYFFKLYTILTKHEFIFVHREIRFTNSPTNSTNYLECLPLELWNLIDASLNKQSCNLQTLGLRLFGVQ